MIYFLTQLQQLQLGQVHGTAQDQAGQQSLSIASKAADNGPDQAHNIRAGHDG